jgi:hypothetical protein
MRKGAEDTQMLLIMKQPADEAAGCFENGPILSVHICSEPRSGES